MMKRVSLISSMFILLAFQTSSYYAYENQSTDTTNLEYKRFNPQFKSYQYIETERTLGYRYYEFNDHIYKLIDSQDWFTAKDIAESNGGYLASITSDAENQFIYNLLINDNVYNVYFGAEDNDYDGVWEWSNGEGTICTVDEDYNVDDSYGYCNWNDGEPNSELSNSGVYESVGMFYFKYSYTWNDGTNYNEGTFITEYESPQPTVEDNTKVVQVKEPFYDGYILAEGCKVSLVDKNGNVLQTTTADSYGYAYFDTSNIDDSSCMISATYESSFSNGISKDNEGWYCYQKQLYNQFEDACRIVTITSGSISLDEDTIILTDTSYRVNISVALDSSTTKKDVESFIDRLSNGVYTLSNGKYSIGEVMYFESSSSLDYRFNDELTATKFDMCDIRISSNCSTNYYGEFSISRPITDVDSMVYQGLEITPSDFESFNVSSILSVY